MGLISYMANQNKLDCSVQPVIIYFHRIGRCRVTKNKEYSQCNRVKQDCDLFLTTFVLYEYVSNENHASNVPK